MSGFISAAVARVQREDDLAQLLDDLDRELGPGRRRGPGLGGQGAGTGLTATGRKSVKGLTLDTGALLALERGDSWVRALLRRALETGLP